MLIGERLHLIVFTVFSLLLSGCNETVTPPETNPFGILLSYEGCKTFAATSSPGSSPHSSSVECIEFEYNREGLLKLNHINSGFNCCPGKISADISVSGSVIYIEEKEQEQGCFCQCLFDVIYEFHELAPGEYTIEIKGLYIEDADEKLRFNVELIDPGSETLCVNRTHYPWNTHE